ncbi:MAG: RNA polymerase sigma factor, partial [Bacillota bacterium]
ETQVIEACKGGDRRAFAGIVERYYPLVCAVAYSATGDVGLSEDVCQETFITAWRKLGELREPGKLRGWLCGIARNLGRNVGRARQARREEQGVVAVMEGVPAEGPGPEEQAITKEEEALLWRSLRQIPEEYREALVLFYRQEKSAAEVAEAMGLSEEAVRQRLSRGRKMLEEHVASFVESALRRSAPSKALVVAIVAALPAVVPQVAAASVGVTAAKGSAAAQAAAMTGLAGAIFGPILGLLGAWFGVHMSLKNARSPRERAFILRSVWTWGVYLTASMAVIMLSQLYLAPRLSRVGLIIEIVGLTAAYCIGICILVLRWNRRIKQIQQEDGTYVQPHYLDGSMTPGNVLGSLGGGAIGAIAWLVALGGMSRDWLTVGVAIVGTATIWAVSVMIAMRRPRAYFRVAAAMTVLLGMLSLLLLNLRWPALKAAAESEAFLGEPRGTPLWVRSVIIGVVFAAVAGGMIVVDWRRKRRRRMNEER